MGICIWSQYELPGVWILRVWCHLHATFQAEKRIMTRTPKKSLEKSLKCNIYIHLSSFIGSAFFINGFCTGDMYGPVVFQEQGEMDVLSKPRATQVGRSPPSSPTKIGPLKNDRVDWLMFVGDTRFLPFFVGLVSSDFMANPDQMPLFPVCSAVNPSLPSHINIPKRGIRTSENAGTTLCLNHLQAY